MPIGLHLRTLRKQKNTRLEDIAEKMAVSVPTVTRWENGGIDIPGSRVEKYLTVLGIPIDVFFSNATAQSITKIDEALVGYPDLLECWNEIKNRPDLQLFITQVKTLSPKVVRQVIAFIKAIESNETNED